MPSVRVAPIRFDSMRCAALHRTVSVRPSVPQVVMQGYLEKKSPKAVLGVRAWQKRYFEVTHRHTDTDATARPSATGAQRDATDCSPSSTSTPVHPKSG